MKVLTKFWKVSIFFIYFNQQMMGKQFISTTNPFHTNHLQMMSFQNNMPPQPAGNQMVLPYHQEPQFHTQMMSQPPIYHNIMPPQPAGNQMVLPYHQLQQFHNHQQMMSQPSSYNNNNNQMMTQSYSTGNHMIPNNNMMIPPQHNYQMQYNNQQMMVPNNNGAPLQQMQEFSLFKDWSQNFRNNPK
jgi:hypothetical protein